MRRFAERDTPRSASKVLLPSPAIVPVSALIVLLGATLGCQGVGGLFAPSRAKTQADAGSVHVAVLSVAPWEEYRSALQPQFQLTENEALKAVVPDTQAFQQSVLDLIGGGGGYAQQAKAASSSSPSPSVKQTGSADDHELPTHHEPTVLNSALQLDPMLKYRAATALFQEVQLLNRYLQDAAVSEGYTPYVVRVQLTLMPRLRSLPYDAYATLSFFTSSPDTEDEPQDLLGEDAQSHPTASQEHPGAKLTARADMGVPLTRARGNEQSVWKTPKVLPLMVTDDLESSIQSRMIDNVRALALSLAYFGSTVGGSLNLERINREIESVYGRDVNSLFTVARLSENTMYVRLGAMAQSSSRYAMVPQTHNITLLLLVPSNYDKPIQLVTETTFVDAGSGATLEPKSVEELDRQLDQILAYYGSKNLSRNVLLDLLIHVQRNDQQSFFARLEQALGPDESGFDHPRSLWVDLALVMNGSRYASTVFELAPPKRTVEVIFPPPLAVLVTDAGEKGARAVLKSPVALGDIDAGDGATLIVRKGDKVVSFGADKIVFDAIANELQIDFPSPNLWGLAVEAKGSLEVAVELRLGQETRRYQAVYRTVP